MFYSQIYGTHDNLLNDLLLLRVDNRVHIDYHVTDRKSAENTLFQIEAWRKTKT